jgi:uncharacterized protein YjdB
VQASASIFDASHKVLDRAVTWSSDNTSVATVSATGLITTVTAGTANIVAASEGKTGSAQITVAPVPPTPVATITVTPGSLSLTVGTSRTLTASTLDGQGATLSGRAIEWSTDNAGIATVSSAGVVSAVAPGTAAITAKSEGKTASSTVTVTRRPVGSITLDATSAGVVLGGTLQLTATVKDAADNVVTDREVSWSSEPIGVATVSSTGLVSAIAVGTATVTATSEGKSVTATITVTAIPVATVEVALSRSTVVASETSQASAVTFDAGHNVLGRAVVWNSDNTAVATVSASGLVTSVSAGTANIIATSEGKSGSAQITVTPEPPAAVASVRVTPDPMALTVGGTTTLGAAVRDAQGNALSGRMISWSSDNSAVATVSSTGVVSAVSPGTAHITATSEGQSGSSTLTVSAVPVASVSVSLTPSTITAVETARALATITDASGNALTGRLVTWTTSDATVATIDATGAITPVAPGTTVITATSETKTGVATLTVTPAPVAAIAVSLTSSQISAVETTQASAVLTDAQGRPLTGRTVTWTSSDDLIATVATDGLVTAVSAGSAIISATSERISGAASLTVTLAPVATVTVSPAPVTLVAGGTQQLSATLKDARDGPLTGRVVTWSSSSSAFATVDANGLVTAVAAGTTTITATSEGKAGTSTITVTQVPVATVTVTPVAADVVVSKTLQLAAVTKDAAGTVLTGREITWSSNNNAHATVDLNGKVTAVSAGPATITAASESKTGTSSITVIVAPVASVTVSPSSSTLDIAGTSTVSATLRDVDNNLLSGRTVTWTSDNSAVASVDPTTGLITARSAGTATITATSEGRSGTASVTVSAPSTGVTGLLHVSTTNSRYFADPTGKIVYLTGSHFWKNVQDDATTNPPDAFDNATYLNFLQSHNHNFTRLWLWEQAKWSDEVSYDHYFSPTIYVRVPGSGTAADGGDKFDLNQINPAYLARLRQRVLDAKAKGIYVSVMLFDGWSVEAKEFFLANPWLGHPFNRANNINGIDGDPNDDGSGKETQTGAIAAITNLQKTYVSAVIDAVNDLDNVIYEISNESDAESKAWQYDMINYIHSYETGKPKQHPVGMTFMWPGGTDADLVASPADWISLDGDAEAPDPATGGKVSIWDTDHLCGICGSVPWVWKALTTGHNPILMDGYDGSPGVSDPSYNKNDPKWEAIRTNMGYARSYAARMDLAHAVPHPELCGTAYCLVNPGVEYLVYSPSGFGVTVHLEGVPSTTTFSVEWFNTTSGQATVVGDVQGGAARVLDPPHTGGDVVYLLRH